MKNCKKKYLIFPANKREYELAEQEVPPRHSLPQRHREGGKCAEHRRHQGETTATQKTQNGGRHRRMAGLTDDECW